MDKNYIKDKIADTNIIYERGSHLYRLGNFNLVESLDGSLDNTSDKSQRLKYLVDGNYGDYDVEINITGQRISGSCSCPYPRFGCKHVVAVCLDIADQLERRESTQLAETGVLPGVAKDDAILTYNDIRDLAMANRKASARPGAFELIMGEWVRGEHLIRNKEGKQYTLVVHDLDYQIGYCSCPDYNANGLGTCKHLLFAFKSLLGTKEGEKLKIIARKQKFPFVHLYWDSQRQRPRYYYDRKLPVRFEKKFDAYFDDQKTYNQPLLKDFYPLIEEFESDRMVRIEPIIYQKINDIFLNQQLNSLQSDFQIDLSGFDAEFYPYQKAGIEFALFRSGAIIADEMGLGKTIQAIAIALLKRDIFHFNKVLVVTPSSLKEQWRREIKKFTGLEALVILGSKNNRQDQYLHQENFFKITNYEAVLRDVLVLKRYKPDLVILDEAQRIKNFATKTHQAINSIPRKHSLVLTGTPMENKLEDLYAIVQFTNPYMLAPLWKYAAEFFIMTNRNKIKVEGYRNLGVLHEKLKSILIRRRKEEVLKDLPEKVSNNYYVDLTREQKEIHQGYFFSLVAILNKKFITPMEMKQIQRLLTSMRMVCNSTYLIDRKTNLSPKLIELEGILEELVKQNGRKTVIFSEWTTMTFLIGKLLSQMGLPFVELTGKVPVEKRPLLINEFMDNPDCMVFLSTDAGGVGLNLQKADCVVNFELPWNPAKLNQRIGRVMRIGQESKCVNVVNLIAKMSIEERVLAGISMKQEVFGGVFDGTVDSVDLSMKKKDQFINELRKMFNEDAVVDSPMDTRQEEIAEDTKHFLNPQALAKEEPDFVAEDGLEENGALDGQTDFSSNSYNDSGTNDGLTARATKPQQLEDVLNQGMAFLNGLMKMTSGQSLYEDENYDQQKMIQIDKESGEVIMKFKLPNFGKS